MLKHGQPLQNARRKMDLEGKGKKNKQRKKNVDSQFLKVVFKVMLFFSENV